MRRRTVTRDLIGSLIVFAILVSLCFGIILTEHFLENFKSH